MDVHQRSADEFERARERTLQALGLHFAYNDLSMEDLERRLELAVRATSFGELEALEAHLPPLSEARSAGGDAMQLRVVDDEKVPPRGVLAAFMGGTERKGRWLVPKHLKVWAVMGGVELDLRNARFAPGVTEIEVTAIMGGVSIAVPHDVGVESTGVAFAGGFVTDAGDPDALDEGRPIIRLSGMACMGGVEAAVKRPSTKAIKKFERKLAKIRKR